MPRGRSGTSKTTFSPLRPLGLRVGVSCVVNRNKRVLRRWKVRDGPSTVVKGLRHYCSCLARSDDLGRPTSEKGDGKQKYVVRGVNEESKESRNFFGVYEVCHCGGSPDRLYRLSVERDSLACIRSGLSTMGRCVDHSPFRRESFPGGISASTVSIPKSS